MAHIKSIRGQRLWVFDNYLESAEFIAKKPRGKWTDKEFKLICELLAEHTTETPRIYEILNELGRTGDENIL